MGWKDRTATGTGQLSRLHVEAGRTAAMLLSDLDSPASPGLDQRAAEEEQLRTVASGSPAFVAASAGIALGFARLAAGRFPESLVLPWAAAALAASLAPPALWWLGRRRPHRPLTAIRTVEILALLLGLVWAAFPALFFDAAQSDMRIFMVAASLAICGIGSLALARIPAAAIIYCALISGSLSLTSVKLGGDVGVTFGAFTIACGFIIAGMVLRSHARERRLACGRQELQRQKDVIALLLNDFEKADSDWLWETGPDFRLTYSSPRLAQLLGTDEAAVSGLELAAIAGPVPGLRGWAEFRQMLHSHEPIHGHTVEMQAGGASLHWRITARPLHAANGTFLGYRGVGRDITTERQALLGLVAAKDQAERSNASKSHFLAVMSHELKTPLNAIVGFSELLVSPQADFLSETQRADHLRTILESSRHLQALISDILDATRIEKGTMKLQEQEADAAELVEVAVKMCRDAAERADTTIVARIMDGVEVRGDITRIKQVLINLITNAVKFSAAGGFVYVGFERQESGGLAITIRDSGFGISAEDIARVFEPFVQADAGMARRFGGIGLGLSIARKLARLHGGDVTLESEAGAGTTARLILPAARVDWPAAGRLAGSAAG